MSNFLAASVILLTTHGVSLIIPYVHCNGSFTFTIQSKLQLQIKGVWERGDASESLKIKNITILKFKHYERSFKCDEFHDFFFS